DVAIEVGVADARLDEARGVVLVHFEHAIHALQVHDHAAGIRGRRAAVTEIAARRDGIQRDFVLIRGADDLLNLLHRVGRDDGRGDALLRLAVVRREGVAVRVEIRVGGEDPVLADRALELAQRLRKIGCADARWSSHGYTGV